MYYSTTTLNYLKTLTWMLQYIYEEKGKKKVYIKFNIKF